MMGRAGGPEGRLAELGWGWLQVQRRELQLLMDIICSTVMVVEHLTSAAMSALKHFEHHIDRM
jgi:hypothetical protein